MQILVSVKEQKWFIERFGQKNSKQNYTRLYSSVSVFHAFIRIFTENKKINLQRRSKRQKTEDKNLNSQNNFFHLI